MSEGKKKKRRRRGFVVRETTVTKRKVVSICDFAIDQEASNIKGFKEARDSSYLGFHLIDEDDPALGREVPMKFVVRNLDASAWRRANIEATANAEDSDGKLSGRAAGISLIFSAFKRGVVEVIDFPRAQGNTIKLVTLTTDEALKELPHDFIVDIGAHIVAISTPAGGVEIGEDVGK